MKTVAVTGAGGFLGKHVSEVLAAAGHSVRAISRAELTGDSLTRALTGADIVVHLAGLAHVVDPDGRGSQAYTDSIVTLTRAVARSAVAAGVQRFIYMSSAGVLGVRSPPGGFLEDATPNPHDHYTEAKFQAELLLSQEFAGRLPAVIIRPPLIFGPSARGNFPRLMKAVLSGWPLPVGGMSALRSVAGVRNVADLVSTCVSDSRADGTTLLVADQEAISIAEFVRRVASLAGRPCRSFRVPSQFIKMALRVTGRSRDIDRLFGSFLLVPTRARDLLNWIPPHSLDDELSRTLSLQSDWGRG